MVSSFLVVTCLILGQAEEKSPPKEEAKPAAKAPETAPKPKEEPAEGKTDEALAAKVRGLVKQLDNSQQAKREAAEKDLIALGQDILPLLPAVTARTPAEVKNRLGRVRSALLAQAVEATTKPALVTISGEMDLLAALLAIEKQTGNRLIDNREEFNQEQRNPKITVNLDKAPFWQALDTVLDAGELALYNYDEEAGALAFVGRGEGAVARLGRGSYGGLFRLEATKIEANSDLRNPASRSLRLTVDVAWEPRVRPVVLEMARADLQAVDENGGVMEVDGTEGTLEFPVEGTNAGVELELPFKLPPRSVKQIASVKGKLTAMVLGRIEEFEFTDLDKAKGVEQERGGVIVVVKDCRKNEEIFDVQVRVKFDKAGNALESHRGWIYNNECYLLDAQGNRTESAGLEATLLADNEVGLSYKFALDDPTIKGYKFVYKTPAAIIRIPVDFELKAIDLP